MVSNTVKDEMEYPDIFESEFKYMFRALDHKQLCLASNKPIPSTTSDGFLFPKDGRSIATLALKIPEKLEYGTLWQRTFLSLRKENHYIWELVENNRIRTRKISDCVGKKVKILYDNSMDFQIGTVVAQPVERVCNHMYKYFLLRNYGVLSERTFGEDQQVELIL